MKRYFNNPTQVVFADPDNPGEWLTGIAYHDEIICGCCGGVFNINDVIEMAENDGVKHAIYEYPEWNDITNEIVGGELPEGLEYSENGIVETATEEYEQCAFILDEQEEVQAIFVNTWVDGVAMPSID